MREKAERRHHAQRIKAKAATVLVHQHRTAPTQKQIGKAAAMHNTCPCWACTQHDKEHQRRIFRDLSRFVSE